MTGGTAAGRAVLVPAAAAFLVWCGWVSGFHRDTAGAVVTWVVSLVVVGAVDVLLWRGATGRRPGWAVARRGRPWPRPGRGGPGPALLGLTPWGVLLLVIVVWEVLGIDTGPHQAHLTISALAQAMRPMNAALLAVWMLVGLGYGWARARRPPSGGEPAAEGRDAPPVASAAMVAVLGGGRLPPALLLPSSRGQGVAFWIAVVVVALVIDGTARRTGGRVATTEELVRFLSTGRIANLALVATWVVAGYHLFAR